LADEHFEFRGGGNMNSMVEPEAVSATPPVARAREARLRPEHGPVYPCLTPGLWELAAVVAEKVIAWRLQQRTAGILDRDRVLDPQHFEFRDLPRPFPARQSRPPET
jgi:hypothetical protein